MGLGDPLDQRQPDAAARFAGAACIDLVEALEDPFECRFGNAGAVIVDVDAGLALSRAHFQLDVAAAVGKRIFEQVLQQLEEQRGVGRDHRGAAVDMDRAALAFGQGA